MHPLKPKMTFQSAASAESSVLRPASHLAMPLLQMPLLQQAGLSGGIAAHLEKKILERDNILTGDSRERIARLLRR